MSVDRNARIDLREALIDYMKGEIRAHAFGDRNEPYLQAEDESLQWISRVLWSTYDESIDHPISATAEGWEMLRRVVAFLGTDLDLLARREEPAWPFEGEEQWLVYEHLVIEVGLPDYDPAVHGRPIQPWWDRIPSSVGFAIIGAMLLILLISLLLV